MFIYYIISFPVECLIDTVMLQLDFIQKLQPEGLLGVIWNLSVRSSSPETCYKNNFGNRNVQFCQKSFVST